MQYISKEQLTLWRQQGMSNVEIAEMTGEEVHKINSLFSKFKIARKAKTSPDQIEDMCRMKLSGSSINEIAEALGRSKSSVRDHLEAAGLLTVKRRSGLDDNESPVPIFMAKKSKPKIAFVIMNGKRYMDVTEIYIPR